MSKVEDLVVKIEVNEEELFKKFNFTNRLDIIDKKINAVIEWILNDMQLLNQSARQKLEDKLIGNLKYYKDSHGNTLRIVVDG